MLMVFRGIITKYCNPYKIHKHNVWASAEFLILTFRNLASHIQDGRKITL
jgi:hypothetical protein